MEATLIDSMGTDLTVVNAARVSFAKQSDWVFKADSEEYVLDGTDERLINYLARHRHFTPFTHVMITVRERVPIFVARQRFKHTVGFSYNEVSRRYVDDQPEFFVPDVWRKRAENKKQGSSDEAVEGYSSLWAFDSIEDDYNSHIKECIDFYKHLLESGVAPEQARMVLPQSMYTEYYCTGSLAAWARAYKLRSDPHAQKEIQDLAAQWKKIIEPVAPVSWKALTS